MFSLSAGVAFAAVLVTAVLAAAAWRHIQGLHRQVRELRGRVAALEAEHSTRPAWRVGFEYRHDTREALLHVANDGGDADIWIPLSVEGPLAQQMDGYVYGAWLPDAAATVRMGHRETRTLRLAHLDLDVFPYAQWEIYGARDDATPFAVRAMHTSTIGGDPDTHAPVLFLQLAVVSSPEPLRPTPHCTIALQPFEAIRMQPL